MLSPKLPKGESDGELELLDSAPLVFPGIWEQRQKKIAEETKWREMKKGVHEYKDKRVRTRYVSLNFHATAWLMDRDTYIGSCIDGTKS